MSSVLACCRVLAGVGDLGAHELGEALLDALRHLAQQCAALARREARPRSAQRGARGLHGPIDERGVRLGDRGHDLTVDRIDILESAPLAHELADDQARELAAAKGVRWDLGGRHGWASTGRCAGADCRSRQHPRNNRILAFRYSSSLYQAHG